MFIGHLAVGFAAKKAAPRISLGTTFLACQAADLLWPVLVIMGIERVSVDHSATAFTPLNFEHYPWSHSLGMSLAWALVAFLLLKALKFSHLEAGTLGLVVFSHWILDVLTHRPDVPFWFGDSPKLGFGLWNSVTGTLVVELAMFAIGIWLYLNNTKSNNKKGTWGFWSLIAFLLVVYFGNAFGPKPPVDTPPVLIAGPALAIWLLVAWAYWTDKNRTVVARPKARAKEPFPAGS
jgi:membrane-bound metal-dependent hydrolase YbcI (DUF457 family)